MNVFQTICRRFSTFTKLFLLILISISAINAQSGSVDLSFNPTPSKEAGSVGRFAVQLDGKVLIFGGVFVINGVAKNQIARLNQDGSLDTSFDCPSCDFAINSAIVQPGGKIVIAGSYREPNNAGSVARVQRLNPDGSIDDSFASPFGAPTAQVFSSAAVWATQPDGKVLVSITKSTGGFTQTTIVRLNTNGTFDNTFNTIFLQAGSSSAQFISKLLIQPDGKILISGGNNGIQSGGFLYRFNSDGTPDTTFELPILTSSGFPSNSTYINDFDVQPDGCIVFVGQFVSVNGVERINIARLMPAGNVDLSFAPPNVFVNGEPVSHIKVLLNGKILISTAVSLGSVSRFFRFNLDGSLDNTFTTPTNLAAVSYWTVDAIDRVLLSGNFIENGMTTSRFVRLSQNGIVDNSFSTSIKEPTTITSLAVQADNKVILSGDFTFLDNVQREGIARINIDGSVDTSFNSGSGFDGPVEKIIIQQDGKIIVVGNFSSYNGTSRSGLARLNTDGSLDVSFNPFVNLKVHAAALQLDGKILIGGDFNVINGTARAGLARLNADGSLDSSFNPVLGNPSIRSLLVQGRNKIMVGGSFNGVNGFNRRNLVRINLDGTLDEDFNAGSISQVNQIEVLPDGKYVVLTDTVVRLNFDGTRDETFQSPVFGTTEGSNNLVTAILVQSDGSVIVAGSFTTVNGVPRLRIARLKSNGLLDLIFFPAGADAPIRALVRQSEDRIIAGGDFTRIENVTRIAVARLIISAVRTVTRFDFDGDGRADIAVFRPSNGFWYELLSQSNSLDALQFGQSSDQLAPADYDGDGRTDEAVFRTNVAGAGNFAYFFITNSSNNSIRTIQFGATGDVPVSGDFDGDGRADLAVYRNGSLTGNGQSYFYYRPSSVAGADYRAIAWGKTGDLPVSGDFDGDSKQDAAVYRPSNGTWYVLRSSNAQVIEKQFGAATDIPVAADYDGNGTTDIAVFRPSNGTWYLAQAGGTNQTQNFTAIQFGANGDNPVPADYDGDGRADIAVYRRSNGIWYVQKSTDGFSALQFGTSEDKPVPSAFIYAVQSMP